MSTHIERPPDDRPAVDQWRVQRAIAELNQAMQFHRGERDDTFGINLDAETLKQRRAGAILGCVRAALQFLRPKTLSEVKNAHIAGVCYEPDCPLCNPEDWD